jgi:hypothetical protein
MIRARELIGHWTILEKVEFVPALILTALLGLG